ncbi:uncharacterized protein LOC135089648 isoform X2 [Scylla paramamosain]|uniref:uncharacterized protein LOC135089648 isoform X2 n=1 Tax=Scylla paramamosain TaxID=85552 RepID=UPI00308293C1
MLTYGFLEDLMILLRVLCVSCFRENFTGSASYCYYYFSLSLLSLFIYLFIYLSFLFSTFRDDSKTYHANLMSLVGCTWLSSGDGGERLAVYVHRRLPHPQLHYLTHWSPSLHVQDSRLFSNKVTKNLGGRTVRVLAVNHAPSVFSTADTSGRLHQISGLDIKVMATGLILCGFVVSVFFSSNLTAFMTVVALRPPYTSIGQIIRVIEGRGVLVENTQHLQYLQQTFLIDHVGRSSVRIMFEECINPFGVGAMLTRDTPYKLSFDEIIQRLREGGLVNRFFWEVVREQRFQGNSILSLATEDQERSGVGSLTLNHLQGPFLVLGAGLGSALLLMLLRMAAVTIHKGVSRTSFVGRLTEHIGTHFNDI